MFLTRPPFSFCKNVKKYIERTFLYQKLLSVFLVFLWKYKWQPIIFYYNFFIMFCPGKNPGHTRPQNFGQKNRKMTIFKANPRLVKIVIVQKSYWLTILGPLSVKKCQYLGLCCFLWVWNIALKKGFSKLTLRFLWK